MQFIFNPLFHVALGASGVFCTGLLLKEILEIRKQYYIESGRWSARKHKKLKS